VKPLRRALLGSGRLSDQFRDALSAEGMLLLEEELPGSITYRNYRAPGRYSSWKKEPTSGAIAITASRLVVWTGKSKHIDLPRSGPLRTAVEVTLDGADHVRFGYDAGRFSAERSGQVEVRLRTSQAARIVGFLSAA
jgi:hypothetical protein